MENLWTSFVNWVQENPVKTAAIVAVLVVLVIIL